jgi:hypothetical protein
VHDSAEGSKVLALIDSTRVIESDSLDIGRPIDMAVSANGLMYVSDGARNRVVTIDAKGRITRTFGRKGRGPGEFVSPSFIALAGDTMLLVRDAGQSLVHRFDTRTGALVSTMRLPAMSGRIRALGDDILIAAFNADSQSSVARVSASGALTMQGAIPAYARQHPMMLEPFSSQAFVISDSVVYSLSELSSALGSWRLGTRQASGLEFPKLKRRGVSFADFDAMMRDPANAAQLAYRHSVPMMLERLNNGYLAAAMYDVDMVGAAFTGRFYLSVIDVSGQRACIDIPVPVREDPPARLALDGDTLVAIVQTVTAEGAAPAFVKRWRVDPTACTWVGMTASASEF